MLYQLVFILFVSLGYVSVVHAQPADLEQPTRMRVTGTLLPIEEQQRDDLVTVSILVQDKPLLLRVGKVEELTRTERVQAVKGGVLLRQVRFYGPDTYIGRLLAPEAIGKPLTIEGQLDTRKRQFLVTDVQEGSAGKE
jgi:hypothetical protein